jgi:hypothetical protein
VYLAAVMPSGGALVTAGAASSYATTSPSARAGRWYSVYCQKGVERRRTTGKMDLKAAQKVHRGFLVALAAGMAAGSGCRHQWLRV